MKKMAIVLFVFSFLMQGCGKQRQIAPEPKCLSGQEIDAVMKSAEKALIRMNFVIDKSDANLALIVTKPLAGAQFFEFWRKDSAGGYNKALSSIHSLQRTVELGFSGMGSEICINPKVKVERLSIPEKEIDSAGRAYSMFSASDDTTQNLSLNDEQEKKMDWVDLGRDYQLETVILDRIEKQINKDTKKGNKR
ncbi:MAG: hypothetical protein A2Y10_08890 [Planctomycetes bacterium GWF2_41_51]|nr:MAG: hypothetical protein A2Y10_08890 [Planctomycetes bacterium GWF2_41_51]HBG26221.1 hypothetical protein [Phycisphaerales bacterium]